ncbi:F-box/kelch-repeat protein At3g27150 isoform X2 [Punica granatum]|nr:F-box/kelch-repeat protein At3g27150 isoform X2 [Punica granatum]
MPKEEELECEEEPGTMFRDDDPDKSIKKHVILSIGSHDSTDQDTDKKPKDADYSVLTPPLSHEIEVSILARVPRSEYWRISTVNKRFLSLLRSGEIYSLRRDIGVREPSVFVLASGESSWWAFDRRFRSCHKLPILPSDWSFVLGDKETLSAGTHLIVSGKEMDGLVIWRYELAENRWFKGPLMNNPRCLFASATCGNYAFVAGGIRADGKREVLKTAERYDPESKSWDRLPSMIKKRQYCSGCYMDKKFFVIGGKNEEDQALTCGEMFDESRNKWDLIPDMLKGSPIPTYHSPPLIAVVNDNLYTLETSSNEVRVYMKESNSWRTLGPVPIRADSNKGWGVAFKSLGNELLIIGASSISYTGHGMSIFTCLPDLNAVQLHWRPLESSMNRRSSHFIRNCCVMIA